MPVNEEEVARRMAEHEAYRVRETTITLTNDEWHTLIAACYRAVMSDCGDLLNADEVGFEPDHLLLVMSKTVQARAKVSALLHSGQADQASWSPEEDEG
jgi:hypothetical protein